MCAVALGEGLVGLTRGFMYAGTPRVLVSLWKVDDHSNSHYGVLSPMRRSFLRFSRNNDG
jgi:hypothetical protein